MTRRHIIKQQQEIAEKNKKVQDIINEQQKGGRRANPYAAKHKNIRKDR